MRGEEVTGPVDQQVVQLRLQTTPVGQSKIAAYSIELWSQRLLPSEVVDRDPAFGDLACVADAAIEARLILETIAGRSGDVVCLRPEYPSANGLRATFTTRCCRASMV
jgi:hypothetical protein